MRTGKPYLYGKEVLMTLKEFLLLLGQAYDFPDYYGVNLDAADEILGEIRDEIGPHRLSLEPLFRTLLSEATTDEQWALWRLMRDHFDVPDVR